jgi:hypothetical protein
MNSYTSARDITKMPNACASVLNGVNSGKAMEKCETGHFPCSNAYGLSILDYPEVNALASIDLFHPHRESRSVLESLPFLDFATESLPITVKDDSSGLKSGSCEFQ